MKKLITILAIMIVLVGAVFAADPVTTTERHEMKIYSVVNEILPVFQMTYGGAVTNESTRFSATTHATNNTKATALNSNIDIGAETAAGALQVQFEVNLVADGDGNYAKTQRSFTLTFSDGVFDEVKRNGGAASGTLSPDSIAVAGEEIATGITSITPDNTNTSAPTVVVQFNGNTVTANKKLATATYSYTGDPTIDMGTYYADILLTITNVF